MERKFDIALMGRFLDALTETRSVTKASKVAGMSMATLYRYRKKDPDFALAWVRAIERSDILLRKEAMRRALAGTEHPVVYHGKQSATIRKYNDSLLLNLLKLETSRHLRRERLDAEAAAGKKDELAEILELIDGKTRRIRDGS